MKRSFDLTSPAVKLKYRQFPAEFTLSLARPTVIARSYDLQSLRRNTSEKRCTMNECKHPRVQIVAREEDAEFVECLECGDIFESSEFKDMIIEATKLNQDTKLNNEP
jgi:hypothetical protein